MTQSKVEISNESDYQVAVRALGARSRPSWFLRLLMNALERYRQTRKMGWSRAQNKQGLTVFASYQLNVIDDVDVVAAAFSAVEQQFGTSITQEDARFLQSLRSDAQLMGFLFVHDLVEGDRQFEGMTYSFGRRAAGEPRFRDRVDLIVESEVIAGTSRGISRVRLYVDPCVRPFESHPARVRVAEAPLMGACHELFDRASMLHKLWSLRVEKQWHHWTNEYIEYFGPRAKAVPGTCFPTHVDVIGTFQKAI